MERALKRQLRWIEDDIAKTLLDPGADADAAASWPKLTAADASSPSTPGTTRKYSPLRWLRHWSNRLLGRI
ncbi:hypothetical protein LG3211_2282 [Lysobacter gummosus]|nr:hypothetical protein LG3211_2282 [Lysobacter gummosus]